MEFCRCTMVAKWPAGLESGWAVMAAWEVMGVLVIPSD
jgi:hypothetical protein